MTDNKNDSSKSDVQILIDIFEKRIDQVESQQARLTMIYIKISAVMEAVIAQMVEGMNKEELKAFDERITESHAHAVKMMKEISEEAGINDEEE